MPWSRGRPTDSAASRLDRRACDTLRGRPLFRSPGCKAPRFGVGLPANRWFDLGSNGYARRPAGLADSGLKVLAEALQRTALGLTRVSHAGALAGRTPGSYPVHRDPPPMRPGKSDGLQVLRCVCRAAAGRGADRERGAEARHRPVHRHRWVDRGSREVGSRRRSGAPRSVCEVRSVLPSPLRLVAPLVAPMLPLSTTHHSVAALVS